MNILEKINFQEKTFKTCILKSHLCMRAFWSFGHILKRQFCAYDNEKSAHRCAETDIGGNGAIRRQNGKKLEGFVV